LFESEDSAKNEDDNAAGFENAYFGSQTVEALVEREDQGTGELNNACSAKNEEDPCRTAG
jgi:hypothetical protein